MKFNFKTICFIPALRKIDMPMSTFARSNVQKVPKTQKTDDGCDGRDQLRHIPNVVKQLLNCVRKVQASNSSLSDGNGKISRWERGVRHDK